MGALIEKPNCVSDVDLGGEVSNLSLEYIPPRFGVVARLRNPEAPCDCIFQGVFETRRGKHGGPPVALVVERSNVVTTLPDEFLKFFKRLLAYAHGYLSVGVRGCSLVPVCFRGNMSGLTKRKISKTLFRSGNYGSRLAEREGFEPPDRRRSTVFKTAAFSRSATSPRVRSIVEPPGESKGAAGD